MRPPGTNFVTPNHCFGIGRFLLEYSLTVFYLDQNALKFRISTLEKRIANTVVIPLT